MFKATTLLVLGLAVASAFRFDLRDERFDPDRSNHYHLFTRQNPTISQPLLMGSEALLGMTYFNAQRRTVILLHGWQETFAAPFNSVVVPAFLAAEDVNVIVVDWSVGAASINLFTAAANTLASGESVARFVTWLSRASGTSLGRYHIVGHHLGGHKAGIVGRNLGGQVAYITALDPAYTGWLINDNKFARTDGIYTECIHTNVGISGYPSTLADADFYPNGGNNMPGCNSQECDHERSFHYFAESLRSGGFTGRRCATSIAAMSNICQLPGSLRMGGLVPKTGSSGVFRLETNSRPPFSRG